MIAAKLPFAIRAKFHHLLDFARFAFSERNILIGEARQITQLGVTVANLAYQSDRKDILLDSFKPFVANLYGIWYASLAHHDAIQTLALSGHSLESMVLLRPHLESVLTFLYSTEPDRDLGQVEARLNRYRDWVIVKMKKNFDKSRRLDLVQALSKTQDFDHDIQHSYGAVKDGYADNPQEFKVLEDGFSFLTYNERVALATRYDILNLYHHVFAESSAGIHFADVGDRMTELGPSTYQYLIRRKKGAFWPIMLSNLLQIRATRQFGRFFGIGSIVDSRIRDIMRPE